MSLLTNIIKGTTPADVIVIEDTVDCNGQLLLLAFVKELIRRVTCHEMLAEPAGRDDTVPRGLHFRSDLLQYLKNYDDAEQSNFAVVIDSLSTLIVYNGLLKLSRMLNNVILFSKAGSKKRKLVALLHRDCHDDFTVENIEYLASCVISLTSTMVNSCEYASSILHKSIGGKVSRENIQFRVSRETLDFGAVTKDVKPSVPSTRNSNQKVHQLADKLTFSVSLKQEEKQSRAQLVLPYEKIGQMTSSTLGTGKIVYVPDEADDLDDEDPDDDLNI